MPNKWLETAMHDWPTASNEHFTQALTGVKKCLLLDKNTLTALEERRNSVEDNQPTTFHQLMDHFCQDVLGTPPKEASLMSVASRNNSMFAWHPTPMALIAALFGNLYYLYWGRNSKKWYYERIYQLIISRARSILVNDDVAKFEAEEIGAKNIINIPMYIDTDYFAYNSTEKREKYLFCAGSNDRDGNLLLELAIAGQQVVWLVNDIQLIEKYDHKSANLRLVSKIPYTELRRHYQNCSMVLMPALRDVHAAGQTTGLEAISCGAPLLITKGRTSTIFDHLKSVQTMDNNDVSAWLDAIETNDQKIEKSSHTLAGRKWVENHCNANNIYSKLVQALGSERDECNKNERD